MSFRTLLPISNNELIDLRDFVRNALNKNEKILNSTISQQNWSIRLWTVNDFSNKIQKLLLGFNSSAMEESKDNVRNSQSFQNQELK